MLIQNVKKTNIIGTGVKGLKSENHLVSIVYVKIFLHFFSLRWRDSLGRGLRLSTVDTKGRDEDVHQADKVEEVGGELLPEQGRLEHHPLLSVLQLLTGHGRLSPPGLTESLLWLSLLLLTLSHLANTNKQQIIQLYNGIVVCLLYLLGLIIYKVYILLQY